MRRLSLSTELRNLLPSFTISHSHNHLHILKSRNSQRIISYYISLFAISFSSSHFLNHFLDLKYGLDEFSCF